MSGADLDKPSLSAIVPTLGLSPWLKSCLEALRQDGGQELEILLVAQGEVDVAAVEGIVDRVVRTPSNLGFAAANNLGLTAARGDYLATVNDDAIVSQGWCRGLIDALEQRPEATAAQGINIRLDEPTTVDGAGLAWTHAWQAVQIGHAKPLRALEVGAQPVEIFGVSATAAIYRRSALMQSARGDGDLEAFDRRLFAYYEDVDLACRLRSLGRPALRVSSVRARHAGSVTGERLTGGKMRLIYRNRQLVLARLLGRGFWLRWPRILLRDVADLWSALRRHDRSTAAGIAAGLGAAVMLWPSYARLGRPLVPLVDLRRFQIATP